MSAKKKDADTPSPEVIVAYKGFTADMRCHGDYQYEVGKTYEHTGTVKACHGGFHACEHPLDVFNYYPPAGSKFAVVEQSGKLSRHDDDSKVASSRITIKAALDLPGIIKAAIEYTFAKAKPVDKDSPAFSAVKEGSAAATGDRGAASATGDRGAASVTGDSGAASATGDRGAASVTGDSGAASATGYSGAASATGDRGAASATGYSGAASATGYSGAASATGKASVAISTGYEGRAMAGESGAICLVERDDQWNIVAIRASKVGENGIKPDTYYTLKNGKFVEAT